MQHHLIWVVFVACFSFFNKCECETKQLQAENGEPYILSQLFGNRNKPPIILYLEPRQNVRSSEETPEYLKPIPDDNEEEDNSDENFLKTTQTDERAYLLYHLLRTTIEEEEMDPTAVQRLAPAKEFLRSAFIGRCRNLKKCLRQCPKPKVKYACTVQCKQIYDDLDECDEPKQSNCETPKCGKTMPPTWLL